MTKVTSVRKEEIRREVFLQKKMPEKLSNMKLSYDESKSGLELYKKMVNDVKRGIRKFTKSATFEEIIDFVDELSDDNYSIRIDKLSNKEEDYGNVMRLLKVVYDSHKKSDDDFIEKLLPMRVTCIQGDSQVVGYTTQVELKNKKKHGTRRRVGSMEAKYIFDIVTLLSNALVNSGLREFRSNHMDELQMVVVEELFNSKKSLLKLPRDKSFKEDVLSIAKKYYSEFETKYDQFADEYKNFFYGMSSVTSPYSLEFLVPFFLEKHKSAEKNAETKASKEGLKKAKAFQTKQYITNEKLKVMADNAFKSKYSYVELDNDVSISKFELLEEEFLKFIEHVPVPYCKGNSFRIKKLGLHRAAGIYFPGHTIIDLDHPDSYGHELAHQLSDYYSQDGQLLSEMLNFRRIRQEYKKKVRENVMSLSSDDSFREQWEGKTKYNASYYFQEDEIFARSFELYLNNKNFETSLIKNNYNDLPEYPTDDEFVGLITNYFDEFLSNIETLEKAS